MAWAPSDSWFVPFLRGSLRKAGVTVSDSGPWNPELASAVKTFQGNKGLTKDGIPGPNTWQALGPSLGPMTVLKAEESVKAALTLRYMAYMTAIHAHGSGSDAAQAWSSANNTQLLTILEKFDVWMQQSGAAALLWKYSWPEDKIPPGYPTYDGTSPGIDPKKSKRLGAVGFLPLVVAGPPMLAGGSAAAGIIATAIVKTVGAAAAAAGAAWLGVKLVQWSTALTDSAPNVEETSDTTTVTAPPAGASPPPPSSPKTRFTLRNTLRYFVKTVGKLAAMVVAVLVAGFGVVATLTTAAGPLVVAAAGAAGGVLWLGLAALVAFILGASKRKRYGNG